MAITSHSGRRLRSASRGVSSIPGRPFGVQVIALLQTVNALATGLSVFAGIHTPFFDNEHNLPGAAALVMMVAGLLVALGLLGLNRWAWVATLIWVGIIMAFQLINYFDDGDANFAIMAIAAAQVLYLNLNEVQSSFRRYKPARTLRG
jgi:hypothetical protein